MTTQEIIRALLPLAIGLLLGSVLPADLLARRGGVDIRSRGDGNPGTVNAIRVLGWAPGLLTAAYDLSVGVVAIGIAELLDAPRGIAYLAGIASVVGHRWPAFRGFRGGGQAMAASAGLLLYGIARAVSSGWLSPADIAILIALLALTFAWTRSDSTAAVAMLPFLVVRVSMSSADWRFVVFISAVAAYIWTVQMPVARRRFMSRAVKTTRDASRD